MGVLVRLPEIWWTCACDVLDAHDNEWVEYVEVLASTKDEAYERAEEACTRRGLGMYAATVQALPEKKVPVQSVPALPAPAQAAAAPVRVTEWKRKEPEPEFEMKFFTKYADLPRIVYTTEGI